MIDRQHDVFVIIDVQNDFCPGGALAVPDGNDVVPVINRLTDSFDHHVITQDWHPKGHLSFASSHEGKSPMEMFQADYGPQVLWPDHCVQGTAGAEFHADLRADVAEIIIRKGYRRAVDSYSAFFENDLRSSTGLTGFLRDRGFKRLFIAGLAFDFCVGFTALDARAQGFDAVVIIDACRAIDFEGSAAAMIQQLGDAGVEIIDSDAILSPES